MDTLRQLGGVDGICLLLQTDAHDGLDPSSAATVEARKQAYGENKVPEVEPVSFFLLMVSRSETCDSKQRWRAPGRHVPIPMQPDPAAFLPTLSLCFPPQWGNLQDPIIILLIFAATVSALASGGVRVLPNTLQGILSAISCMQVSTVLGAAIPEQRAKNEWIEGVAIWVAILLVSVVGECSKPVRARWGWSGGERFISAGMNHKMLDLNAYAVCACA